MLTVKERKTSPFQVLSLSTLFLISVFGYIAFHTWHDNKNESKILEQRASHK